MGKVIYVRKICVPVSFPGLLHPPWTIIMEFIFPAGLKKNFDKLQEFLAYNKETSNTQNVFLSHTRALKILISGVMFASTDRRTQYRYVEKKTTNFFFVSHHFRHGCRGRGNTQTRERRKIRNCRGRGERKERERKREREREITRLHFPPLP